MDKINERTLQWLEQRELGNSIPQPLRGVLGIGIALITFYVLWYVFMHTQGILRWYTPLYGFMYISVVLLATIWQAYVLNYWPLKTSWLESCHPVTKGAVLVFINVVLVGVLIWGIFYNVFGKLSLPYLSWPALEEIGVYSYVAREYSSQAILMVATVASFISPILIICFEGYPWQSLSAGTRSFSQGVTALFLTTWVFLLCLHPHFHVLFYPWQKYVAAFPWWFEFARTLSGNFILGIIICMIVSLWLFETIWERYPYRLIKSQPLRGWVGLFCVFLVGALLMGIGLLLQDIAWGKSIPGAARTMAPDWRFVHSGEIAAMILIVATILDTYFDKWPRNYSTEVNIAIRTGITFIGTAFFHYLYYAYSPLVLGTQAGYSHPSQFPMAPFILLIIVMLFHNWFFDLWPLKKISARLEVNLKTETIKKIDQQL